MGCGGLPIIEFPSVAVKSPPLGIEIPAFELVGRKIAAAGKRGPTPKLQQQIERLSHLPKAKQKVVMEMIDGVLSQNR